MYQSKSSKGYNDGFHDSFLNHIKSYSIPKYISIFERPFATNTPEMDYIDNYEKGYEHGSNARKEYLDYTGMIPNSISDFNWLNKERQKQILLDYFSDNTAPEAIQKEKFEQIKNLISSNLLYRALNDSIQFFYEFKNYDGYNLCNCLLARLLKNRELIRNHKISKEDSSAEFSNISLALNNLIDGEIKIIIDSAESYRKLKENNVFSEEVFKAPIDASDFVFTKDKIIQSVIVDNWKIPKTKTPGLYAETYNRIILWFENFKKSEYELALLILCNIKYFTDHEIDQLLEKMCGELKNLFSSDFSKVGFFGLGNYSSDSGSQFLYSLKQKLKLHDFNFPKHHDNLHKNIESIVFIDDIIGTGKQAKDFYDNYLQNLNIKKYYYSLIAFEKGLKSLKINSGFSNVFATKIFTESERAFSDSSEIFSNTLIRTQIKEMTKRYGDILYPKGPLGYDDSQALIVFSHNTPNNTLPIIWASENNEKAIGIPWNPIWERKKISKLKI